MALTTSALILPTCCVMSSPGRWRMKTEAVAVAGLSDSGFFSGTETCTRACSTPSMLEMVWEISCERACVKRARSSSGEETKPSFLKT